MNCIYIPELINETLNYRLTKDELKHIKALRIGNNEKVLATNGCRLSALGRIEYPNKNEIIFHADDFFNDFNENTTKSALAIGILDNKERFEFALEKAIELGIYEFFPLITEYSQRKKINNERLNLKAVSAMKQCCRSVLPIIHPPVSIDELIQKTKEYQRLILADINGDKHVNLEKNISTLVITGPEGGFSVKEIEFLEGNKRLISLNLGERKLRAETAAIVCLGLLI